VLRRTQPILLTTANHYCGLLHWRSASTLCPDGLAIISGFAGPQPLLNAAGGPAVCRLALKAGRSLVPGVGVAPEGQGGA